VSATTSATESLDRRGSQIGDWLIGLGKRLGGVATGSESGQEEVTDTSVPEFQKPAQLDPVGMQ
jgi:hypothetical protein